LTPSNVYVVGSGSAFGSRVIPSEEIDQAFGMPVGKLKNRAGIVSVAYVSEKENEGTLGAQAASRSLHCAEEYVRSVDCIVAASETHHAYPSLAAVLHANLGLREDCSALDVGSGCLAMVQALAVAQALLASGRAGKVLVVSADVHSLTLGPGRAAGEFGGLFGDGASAVLLSAAPVRRRTTYRLGEFFFGCASKYAEAISVCDAGGGRLDVQFAGEALSRAAVSRMVKVLDEVERRSGIPHRDAAAFVTHQPNPRLVALLAKQLNVPLATFPPIAATRGNLGSSTCGAALHAAFQRASEQPAEQGKPFFLASLGPGLLFGGGWMVPALS
jgi:3-oxoacyl-[acyl-carrier-protein] synthase-3